MATTIDQKVVEMRFDNRDFEKNTRQTMSTLEKLKEKLHFKGASDGLEEISKAARKVDMNGLADGIQTVSAKFSAMEVIGTTALVNITNSAVNAGKRFVSSISFDQIASGWDKMVQQMSSMQTLMNSTGKSIEEIEDYLNELMWYSDETSYSFTDMTSALANMTATGGKIDKLVPMIMGMANATAYAGKGAAEFSRIIYNLNQSYGGGYLTLMDWKSVKLAGANSKQLTESLIHWGEALGTIKKGQVSIANFDDTLKDKWVTTQVMEKAFGEFADFTLKVKEAIDSGEYDTASEAIDALAGNYEGISKQAFKAAQDAKSFTEAIVATKDAVSSKWMQVFRTIFGNYNEQRELWSSLANSLWEIFAEPVEKLNSYLQKALGFTAIKEVWDKINNNPIIDTIKEVDGAIKKSSKSLEEYQAIVRKVWRGDFNNVGDNPDRFDLLSQAGWDPRVVQSLVNKTDEIAGHGKGWTVIDKLTIDDVTAAEQKYGIQVDKTTVSIKDQQKAQKALDKLTNDYLRNSCGLTETQIELYHDLVAASRKYGISIDEIVKKMEKTNGRQHLEQSWREIGLIIKETLGAIGKAVGEVFHFNPINLYLSLEKLHEKLVRIREVLIGKWIKKDGEEVLEYSKHYQNLVDTLKGFISILKLAGSIVGGGFKIALTIVNTILRTFGLTVLDVTGAIGNVVSELVAWIEENDFILKGIQWLVETLMGGLKKLWDWADAQWGVNEAFKAFISILKGGKSGLKSWVEGLMAADDVGEYLLDTFGKIPEKINQLWKAFSKTKIDTGSIAKNIAIGLWEGIKKYGQIAINGIKNFGLWILEAFKNILGIHSPSTEFFNFGQNIVMGLFNGIKSLVGLVYNLVMTIGGKIIDIFKGMDIGSVFVAIISAGAVFGFVKMAKAINILADGLQNINAVIGSFAGVLSSFSEVLKGFRFKLISDSIKSLAVSVLMLAAAIAILTLVDSSKLLAATAVVGGLIIVVGGLMGALIWLSTKMDKSATLKVSSMALTILALGVSMLFLASALKKIADISVYDYGPIVAFGVLVVAFMGIVKILSSGENDIVKMGGTLLAMSFAMLMMARVIKILGKMDAKVLDQGMNAILDFAIIIMGMLALVSLLSNGNEIKSIGNTLSKIGIVFILMASIVKSMGKLEPEQLVKGLFVITKFAELIALLILSTSAIGGTSKIEGVGKTLNGVAAVFLAMAISVKVLGSMPVEQLAKGMACVTLFTVLVKSLVKGIGQDLNSKEIAKVGTTLFSISAMFGVLALSTALLGLINTGNLIKGLISVGLLMEFVKGVVKSTGEAKDLGKTLWPLVAAIGVLALSVGLLSLISPERLAGPTIALGILMSCFALIIKSCKSIGAVKQLLPNLAIMIGVISALAIIVALISGLDPQGALSGAAAIALLAVAMMGIMFVLDKMGGLSGKAMLGIIGLAALIALMYPVVDILSKMSNVRNAMQSTLTLTVFMGALSLVLLMTAAVGAIYLATFGVGLLGLVGIYLLLDMIQKQMLPILSSMNNIQNAQANCNLLIGLMTVMTDMLFKISLVGPLALMAVTALGALLLMMPMLVSFAIAIGALFEAIPQLQGFLNTGLPVMIQLAGAIGEMIGAFVSGTLTQLSASLPVIGANLSLFMVNATPFIAGMQMVNAQTLKGTGILVGCILALTATDVINGIASFFTGGFAQLGTELSLFALNALPFLTIMSSIPAGAMEGVKALSGAVLALTAANILDGLSRFFGGGGSSLAQFGTQLPPLGESMAGFVEKLGEFSDKQVSTVNCAGQAIKCLAEAADKLPKTGGIWQKMFGEGSLSSFAESMPGVATGVKGFVTNLGEFGDQQIKTSNAACKVITALAEAAKVVGNDGGFWQGLFGSKNNGLAEFAKNMKPVGQGVKDFITELEPVKDKWEVAQSGAKVIESIAKLSDIDFKKANENLPKFGGVMVSYGKKLKEFVDELKGLSKDDVDSANNNLNLLTAAVQNMINTINNHFEDKSSYIVTTVEKIGDNAAKGFGSDKVIKQLKTQAKNFVQGFANGINNNSSIAEDAARQVAANALDASAKRLDERSPSKETEQQGEYFGEGFVLGIKKYSTRIYNVSSEVGNEAKRGLSAAVAKISNLVESNMDSSPTIRPVLDLSEVSDGIGYLDSMFGNPSMQLAANLNSIKTGMSNRNQNGNADVVSAIDKLGRNLGNSNGNTYNINGITYDNNSSVNQAIQDLIRAIKIERRV